MRTVTPSEAQDVARWLDQNAAMIVDLREPDEIGGDCLSDAVSMPPSRFDPGALPAGHGKRVVFLSNDGVFSASAGQVAVDDGWLPQSWFVEGGARAWAAAGLPFGGCG
ncbi:MAG: rhodanese-like domain-containing protein [Rhodospirillaceae bacterium]